MFTVADPGDKSFLNRTDLSIAGTLNDANLVGYNIAIVGPSGSTTLDTGTQNRANYTFGRISDLGEDSYTLAIDANDLGENQARLVRTFTIDRTPPKVTLETPKAGEYYGNTKNVIDITGAVVEKNLERYSLRYGAGEMLTDWKEVVVADTVPTTSKLSSLKVGNPWSSRRPLYRISLRQRQGRVGRRGQGKDRNRQYPAAGGDHLTQGRRLCDNVTRYQGDGGRYIL